MSVIYSQQDEHFPNDMLPISPDALCLGKRVDALERGKVHTFAIIVNRHGKKTWTLQHSTKLENDE